MPVADRLNHLVRLCSFFAVFACMHWLRAAFATQAKLDRLCLWTVVLMAAVKVGICVAVAGFDVPLADAMDLFGFETVTLTIAVNILRLQFPSDIVCMFLLAVYCGGRSRWRDGLFLLCASIVIFLSFSRFYFFSFVVALFVRSAWLKRWDLITTLGTLALVGALAFFGAEIVERFVGQGAEMSDEIRVDQTRALASEIERHPILGRGIGASVPDFLRSETLPFSYEVQWYAVVMQFGWLGMSVFVLNIASLMISGVRRTRSLICLAVVGLLWVAAGFTNPLITAIGSAVGLAIAKRRALLS